MTEEKKPTIAECLAHMESGGVVEVASGDGGCNNGRQRRINALGVHEIRESSTGEWRIALLPHPQAMSDDFTYKLLQPG